MPCPPPYLLQAGSTRHRTKHTSSTTKKGVCVCSTCGVCVYSVLYINSSSNHGTEISPEVDFQAAIILLVCKLYCTILDWDTVCLCVQVLVVAESVGGVWACLLPPTGVCVWTWVRGISQHRWKGLFWLIMNHSCSSVLSREYSIK